ncbi:protein KRI1 homolog [Actinia tenebrosa]|uniref:Protein KRI1 homolog n=1 Tax=Actinia tenebrosa TaxID=6105 RepID=A0A6P8IHZ0_ACTTE|nr:protein KRI1 homolog [Actinia tenebrosa]
MKTRGVEVSVKAKYGERDYQESDSSSSETEDEDAKELTAQKEKDFLKVLSLLKKKDPKIYDKGVTFYHQESSSEEDEGEKEEKPKKPVFLKDYERERLLEKGSKAFISDDESNGESDDASEEKGVKDLTYSEEQKALKDRLKAAITESDEEDGGFLSLRQKSKEEKQKEESDYKEWLKGVKNGSSSHDTDLETLQQFWSNPSLDQDEQFLRNYILGKGYIDKDVSRIPTYNEIVDDEKEDEEELEKQEEFERKFNFRFEEPDAEFVKTYPRTVNASVRQKDDKRIEARKKREERKKKEKEQKREELKRLKNLKRKEIQEKLEKLKEITGNPNVGFTEDDVDDDFDPKKYDSIMEKVFNEGYYEDEEGEKPTFDDGLDLEEEENWDEWVGPSQDGNYDNEEYNDYNENHNDDYYDDCNFNMDADYDPSMETQQPKRNRKNPSSKLTRALNQKKPLFDPNEKTFEEYFDEYYKLDYEDIISDLPCRFKYRNVLPNDYGLSTEEVLSRPERELNQWVSVKKMSQYRTDEEERRDIKKFLKFSRDERRKQRIFSSTATASEISTPETKQSTIQKDPTEQKTNFTITKQERKIPIEKQITNDTKPQQKQETKTERKEKGKMSQLKRMGWKRRLTPKEAKDQAQKKKLARQFKGAKREQLAGLTVDRLAAYGLRKKRKVAD